MPKRERSNQATVKREILIAEEDRMRLDVLLRQVLTQDPQKGGNLAGLVGELQRARIIRRAEIPPDVVTMHSTVRMRDLESGDVETFTLVYPHEVDIEEGKLSILAPIGTALLGYRAGDVVEWPVPAGITRFLIEEAKPHAEMSQY